MKQFYIKLFVYKHSSTSWMMKTGEPVTSANIKLSLCFTRMRGQDDQQSAMFSYLSPEQWVPATHPLRAIRHLIDRALKGLRDLRSSFDCPEKLLLALSLQVLYTIRSSGC